MIYDIESAYGTNMSRLKSDLDSNNDSQVLTIFNNDIKNKYLNKDLITIESLLLIRMV